jgi:HK97 gp10 family phage protein
MPDDFMKQLETLEKNTSVIIEGMLEAGGKIGLGNAQSALAGAVGHVPNSRSTGELQASLGLTAMRKDRNGVYNVKVGFNEPRRGQTAIKLRKGAKGRLAASRGHYTATNAMIANVLEFGKHGQRPRPFMLPARLKSEKPVEAAMQAELDKAVK